MSLQIKRDGHRASRKGRPTPEARGQRSEVRSRIAFTLIEMLVVISVIAILAALIFPVVATVKKQGILNRTRTEMEQVVTGLETFKGKKGFYPPGTTNVQNQA